MATVKLQVYESCVLDRSLDFKIKKVCLENGTSTRLSCVHLIPGGRWIVALASGGRVVLYDLKSAKLQPKVVLNAGSTDQQDGTLDNLNSLLVWIDPSSTNTRFLISAWNLFGLQHMSLLPFISSAL